MTETQYEVLDYSEWTFKNDSDAMQEHLNEYVSIRYPDAKYYDYDFRPASECVKITIEY